METQLLKTKDLKPCPIQLRPVRKQTLEYVQLMDSVRAVGVLSSLLVRTTDNGLEVVDGAHRLAIAKDAGIDELPCIIRQFTDEQVRFVQVEANASVVTTEVSDYALRLWKIVELNKTMTINELAHSIHKNVDWTKRMIGLVNLCSQAKKALGAYEISVSLAIELAKLPFTEQLSILDLRQTASKRELTEMARDTARQLRLDGNRLRQDRKSAMRKEVSPMFRPMKQVIREMECPQVAHSVITECGDTDPISVWQSAMRYVLSVDPDSVERRTQLLRKRNAKKEK